MKAPTSLHESPHFLTSEPPPCGRFAASPSIKGPTGHGRYTVSVAWRAPCGPADEDEDQGPRRHDQALLLCVIVAAREHRRPCSRTEAVPAHNRRDWGHARARIRRDWAHDRRDRLANRRRLLTFAATGESV